MVLKFYRSMEFYQQFFDVDTDDVLRRLVWSVLPRPGTDKLNSSSNFFSWIDCPIVSLVNIIIYRQDGDFF